MGKETKIGLAVIGLLLAIFSGLLLRHLSVGEPVGQWDDETRAAAQSQSQDEPNERPNVVTAQPGEPGSDSEDSLWAASPDQATSGPDVGVPAGSYMPAEDDPYADSASDRYTIGRRSLDAGESAGSGNPFADSRPGEEEATQTGQPPSRAPTQFASDVPPGEAPAGEPRSNPLRRLSAELPLEERTAEPNEELADQDDRRYPVDPEPMQPVEPAPVPEPSDGTAPLSDSDESGPTVATEPPDDFRDPFEGDDLTGEPQQDPFADEAPPERYSDDPGPEPLRNDDRPQPVRSEWATTQPAPEPAAVGSAPLPVENGMYTVQPNDTLWSISEKVYGTGGYFKALAAHNQAMLPRRDQLSVGMKVAVPSIEELERKHPSLCPKRRKSALVQPRAIPAMAAVPRTTGRDVYVVQEGDTLFDIARYELGKAARWAEIYELNRDALGEDFDYLQPGIELKLPPKSREAETLGRGGDSRYLR